MRKTVGLKGIFIILAAAVFAAFLAVVWKPVEAEAGKNKQIYGLVFWGTSNVSRMYNDLGYETWVYGNDSGAGVEEQTDHIWASNVDTNSDYRNYFEVPGSANISNYWVGDAMSTADVINGVGNVWSGQTSNGLDVILSKIMKDDSVSEENDKKLDYAISGDSSKLWVEEEKTKEKNSEGEYEVNYGNDVWKTAIVLWTGEDWVIRGDGSDTGVSTKEELQDEWMNQITAEWAYEYGDSTADWFKKRSDYDPDDNYPEHEYKTVSSIDRTEYVSADEYGASYSVGEGYGTNGYPLIAETDEDGNEVTDDDGNVIYVEDTTAERNTGATALETTPSATHTSSGTFLDDSSNVSNYVHQYVFDNSYIISDEDLAAFSYTQSSDGITVELEHALSEPTDAFPADADLATQAATCFSRLISGYTYQVEYLTQNTTAETDQAYEALQSKPVTIWTPVYHEPVTEDSASNSALHVTGTYSVTNGSSESVYEEWTSQEDVEYYSNKYNCGEVYLTELGHNLYHPTTMVVTDNIEVNTYTNYYITTVDGQRVYAHSDGTPLTSDEDYHIASVYYTHDYTHNYIIDYTIEHPAYYDWSSEDYDEYRCDDGVTPGYADSYHNHTYGGTNGLTSSGEVLDVIDDDGNDVEHYVVESSEDNSLNGYQSMTVGANSENDHRAGETHIEWYTDTNKPIMQVVTENRSVIGYIDYWHHYTSSSLKVYVFSLGPYNKSIYEDQMDDDWTDTNTNEVQVEQTQRIEDARTTWNHIVQSEATNAQFMDIYDKILEETPYYRYQNISVDDETGNASDTSDAQHGKWYDRKTNEWIFHAIWNTVLEDNPNEDDGDEIVDSTFYGLTSSLTAYANIVTSPTGRDGEDDIDFEVEVETEDGGTTTETKTGKEQIHTLAEVSAGGMSAAGAFLGYGDTDYDFIPHYMTVASATSTSADYTALNGIEGYGEESDGVSSPMYEYARYGKLLEELGIDETGNPSTLVSGRTIPGFLTSISYVANSGLVVIWDLALQGLKVLNPFEFLADASYIASVADEIVAEDANAEEEIVYSTTTNIVDPYNGVSEEEDYEPYVDEMEESSPNLENYISEASGNSYSGNYLNDDDSTTRSFFVQLAVRYPVFRNFMAGVGNIYDTMVRFGYLMVLLFVVCFVAAVLLFNYVRQWYYDNNWIPRLRKLIVRFLFIIIGVPLLGLLYTEFLNSVDEKVTVVSSGSSDIVAATYIDFAGWVQTERLSPLTGTVLESEDYEKANVTGGIPSEESYTNLRKTISTINESTGVLSELYENGDLGSASSNDLNDSEWFNNRAWRVDEVDANDESLSDIFSSNFSLVDNSGQEDESNWTTDWKALQQVYMFLNSYSTGDFYYASEFESSTLSKFYSDYPSQIGRRRGNDEDAESWDQVDNNDTLYQLFQETQGTDTWLNRTVEENTEILTNSGDYATTYPRDENGDIIDSEVSESTDWRNFNMFANGAMTAKYEGDRIVYSEGETEINDVDKPGLDMSSHVGLSTLSMYNYLSTNFGDSTLTVYSLEGATSGYTEMAHYSVNLAGKGFYQWIYYINCLAFLAVAAIVGLVYALQMIISIIKSCLKIIINVPMALVGVISSISTIIICVVTMIMEILITMILYSLISDIMMAIVNLFEGPMVNGILNARSTLQAVVGTGATSPTVVGYMIGLLLVSVVFVLFGVWLVKNNRHFMKVFDKVQEYIFGLIAFPEGVPESVQKKWKEKARPKEKAHSLVVCTLELLKS